MSGDYRVEVYALFDESKPDVEDSEDYKRALALEHELNNLLQGPWVPVTGGLHGPMGLNAEDVERALDVCDRVGVSEYAEFEIETPDGKILNRKSFMKLLMRIAYDEFVNYSYRGEAYS